MPDLSFTIVMNRINDNLTSLIIDAINTQLRRGDHDHLSTELLQVNDYPAITFSFSISDYIPSHHDEFWQDLFSQLERIRDYLGRMDTRILQIVFDRYRPPSTLLNTKQGIWIPIVYSNNRELVNLLHEKDANIINNEWYFLPFAIEDPDVYHQIDVDRESEYEICLPDERLRAFGRRINDSRQRIGVPVNLRIRMAEGYKISDYISAAFESSLKSFEGLDGLGVILTTVLQMNDKLLPLVNHYSEKLPGPEELNLYSLSAMNLSLTDTRDETNIAVLVSSGKLIINEIRLGG